MFTSCDHVPVSHRLQTCGTSHASRLTHSHFFLSPNATMPPRFRTKQTAKKSTGIKALHKCILPSEEATDSVPKRTQMDDSVPPMVSCFAIILWLSI